MCIRVQNTAGVLNSYRVRRDKGYRIHETFRSRDRRPFFRRKIEVDRKTLLHSSYPGLARDPTRPDPTLVSYNTRVRGPKAVVMRGRPCPLVRRCRGRGRRWRSDEGPGADFEHSVRATQTVVRYPHDGRPITDPVSETAAFSH